VQLVCTLLGQPSQFETARIQPRRAGHIFEPEPKVLLYGMVSSINARKPL
jgi:hypothetical protein